MTSTELERDDWVRTAHRLGEKLDAAWRAIGFDPDAAEELSLAEELTRLCEVLAQVRAERDALAAERGPKP